MDFSINNKKFYGDYYNQIISGIHKRYKKIYPNTVIDTEYSVSKTVYTFFVYVTLDVINENGIAPEKTLIRTYNNFEAITYFSSIPLEDYMAEYDDSKKNYLEKFVEEVQAVILSYKMLGLDIEPFTIDSNAHKYCIVINKKHSSSIWSQHDYIFGRFKFKGMMTKEENENHLRSVKGQMKKYYEKWLERQ